jgi:hypothetical protein
MLEQGGSVVMDLSRLKNHGTLTNMDSSTDWVPGARGGSCLDFDGSNDHVLITSQAQELEAIRLQRGFSVSYWVRRTGTWASTTSRGLCTHGRYGAGSGGWGTFLLNTSGTYTHQFSKHGVVDIASGIANTQNVWEHVLWTVNSSNVVQLSLDGVLRFTSANTTALIQQGTTWDMVIGGLMNVTTPALFFPGQIDDVRLYSTVVDPWELYARPWAPFVARKIRKAGAAPAGGWGALLSHARNRLVVTA